MQYIPAKNIITKVKPSPYWFAFDYNMNIYRGCCHGCIYCDSRSDCYQIEDFATVKAKEHSTQKIYEELKKKRRRGIIATGSMSDPYNPFEKELRLTRQALELIDNFRFGAAIATKSPLITRDIDVLQKINAHSSVLLKITITTADDALGRKIEPLVAPASERFAAVKELSKAGLFTGILLIPVLPFINDTPENILNIVRNAKASGAAFIYPSFGVTLRMNQRDYFYERLDLLFPGVKEQYVNAYGQTYACQSPLAKELYRLFETECRRNGILYKMPDIIKAYHCDTDKRQYALF